VEVVLPSPLFVSHGAPTLILEPSPARDFLASLGPVIGHPQAIVIVSAHWDTSVPRIATGMAMATIHDFYGFPDPLYRLRYPAAGSPDLAARIMAALHDAGLAGEADGERGLDHGAWVPLMLALPQANVPVVGLSIQSRLGAAHQLALGRALGALATDNVLVITSGTSVHNLGRVSWNDHDNPPAWAKEFEDWLVDAVRRGDEAALIDYRARAPHARLAHPTDEHLQPLFVAAGAAGEGWTGRCIHRGFMHGSIGMACFAFDAKIS
jgi:4,5-DOPA dioxygenase extradiol